MDRRRSSAAAARVFEDFEPDVEWKLAGEEQDVVEISLPGFRKDQVRVQVDNHGVLRATGERLVRGGRWVRFKKDLRLPDNCNADGVRARFEAEKLIITLPVLAPVTPSPPPPPPSHSPTPSPPPPPSPPRKYPEPPPPVRQPPPPPPPPPVPSLQYEPPQLVPPPPQPRLPTYPEPPRAPAPRSSSPPAPPEQPRRHVYSEPTAPPPTEQARRPVYPEPTPAAPRPSPTPPSRHGTPGAAPEPKPSTPPMWQTPVSAPPPPPPPAPLPARGVEKKQLQDTTSTMPTVRQEDGNGKDSRPPPPPPPAEKKRSKTTKRADEQAGSELRGKVDETTRGAKQPEKNQAGAFPAVGGAPTTATNMTPEPARKLMVNAAAAVAVLVGVIVAVWRTLQS